MTTEQKERLVQAAFEIGRSTEQRDNPISTAIERSHVVKWFKQGARTILDNPQEWGLVESNVMETCRKLRLRITEHESENQRLREALDSILKKYDDNRIVLYAGLETALEAEIHLLAKEALRQDVPKP